MPKNPKAKPEAPKNPATEAHKPADNDMQMDPDLEAKRSGPPAAARAMPKPMADPEPAPPPEQQQHADTTGPAVTPETYPDLEAKLKDPSFDPEGHERLRLAEASRHMDGPEYPATSDVDERGDPMQPGERNPERR